MGVLFLYIYFFPWQVGVLEKSYPKDAIYKSIIWHLCCEFPWIFFLSSLLSTRYPWSSMGARNSNFDHFKHQSNTKEPWSHHKFQDSFGSLYISTSLVVLIIIISIRHGRTLQIFWYHRPFCRRPRRCQAHLEDEGLRHRLHLRRPLHRPQQMVLHRRRLPR